MQVNAECWWIWNFFCRLASHLDHFWLHFKGNICFESISVLFLELLFTLFTHRQHTPMRSSPSMILEFHSKIKVEWMEEAGRRGGSKCSVLQWHTKTALRSRHHCVQIDEQTFGCCCRGQNLSRLLVPVYGLLVFSLQTNLSMFGVSIQSKATSCGWTQPSVVSLLCYAHMSTLKIPSEEHLRSLQVWKPPRWHDQVIFHFFSPLIILHEWSADLILCHDFLLKK